MSFLRWLFYTWFAIAAGLFLAGMLTVALHWQALPLEGFALWLAISAFIGMSLVFGQWDKFGRPLRLRKWIPLCVLSTALGALGFLIG